MFRLPLYVFVIFSLAACGFKPLHYKGNDNADIKSKLNSVYIESIRDVRGQILRNSLIDRFYYSGLPAHPAYILTVAPIAQAKTDLDITKSSDATRAQLRLETTMILKETNSDQVVLEREVSAITSYNVLQSQFTTRVSEENARKNALEDIANQIERHLSLYFKR